MSAVAIVGLDCRFPGAPDPAAYWDLLMRAADGVDEVPSQRWDAAAFHDPDGGPGRTNTTRGGFVDDPDAFDHEFFALSPREAGAMDPQQRLFLQTVWRALEDAGIPPQRLSDSTTGVYAGIMASEWGQLHLSRYEEITAHTGAGSGYCMVPNRISYHLNLKGPSLAVDTACSSSLVAVHLAVNALLSREVDHAVAGGVNLQLTPALGIFYTATGLSAPDGRCKPFSAQADGIGRGDGVGAVVLRRLDDALADGQQIYAVIRGTAVNQDGRSNGLTAPSRWAQQEVLAAALRRADVDPAQVAFVEAHGTGTALGDMIETRALGHVYGSGRAKPCAVGSVKGNLGHTEAAAGIAGLIKVALSLQHRIVPVSPFATRESRKLGLAEHGLKLIKSPLRLPPGPQSAGLSSFGMGGTNAHAVLETAPVGDHRPVHIGDTSPPTVFTLSANNSEGLRRNIEAQAAALSRRGHEPLAPLAWTSNQVKTGLPHRFAVAARTTSELVRRLNGAVADAEEFSALTGHPEGPHQVAFLFTGQGAQFPGMTKPLYEDCASYRRHLGDADDALRPHLGRSVRDLILSGDERVHRTDNAQPALFAVGYAMARTLIDLGIGPTAVLGHSIGEFAAAVTADALCLDDAARLVAARGSLMQQLPDGGGMISVRAAAGDLAELVADEPLVDIAVHNGPQATVLSGDIEALERIARTLRERGVEPTALRVSHAFHSTLMQPMLAAFGRVASACRPRPPQVPFYSTVRGRALDDEALDGGYWTDHVDHPVHFADSVTDLIKDGPRLLVEIGPRRVLAPLVRRLRAADDLVLLAPGTGETAGGQELAETVAALFRSGVTPRWEALYDADDRTYQRLRPYEFNTRHRFWHGVKVSAGEGAESGLAAWESISPAVCAAPAASADQPSRDDPVTDAVLGAIAATGGYAPDEIALRARFYEDLGFDSVTIMQLKTKVETALPELAEFSVQQLLPHLASVGALIVFLREHTAEAAGPPRDTSAKEGRAS
ncbi:type I polyketide synthase [Streptomyces sp. NPDC056486]|uniref:type I polyketide synthase n=1 Tax=Streptomyces sp. NPDC056486 TaxID=3345835 RepID=UPI0036A606AA